MADSDFKVKNGLLVGGKADIIYDTDSLLGSSGIIYAGSTAPVSPTTGDIWIDNSSVNPDSNILRWRKLATSGQTSISGTDDNSVSLQYTAGYEQVYINGVLMYRGTDYTASNGTSITMLSGLTLSDTIEIISPLFTFVGDYYTQSQSDSKYATIASPTVTTLLSTSSTSFDLINTTATTLNIGGAATALSIGSSTGTTTVNNRILSAAITSGSSPQGAIAYGSLSYLDQNNLATFVSSANTYNQVVIQNTSSNANASADFTISNNLGTASTYYVNLGMNSSTFTGTGSLNLANAGYLTSTTGDLVIATTTANAIRFLTNSSTTDAMIISSSGVPTITNPVIDIINASSATLTTLSIYDNVTSGTIALGKLIGSTAAIGTLNIATNAGITGGTKAINLGTGATAGTTTITIGSTTGSTTNILGTAQVGGNTILTAASTTSALTSFGTSPTLTTPTIDTINTSLTTTGTASLWGSGITTAAISIGGNATFAGILSVGPTSGTTNKTLNLMNGSTAGTLTINVGSNITTSTNNMYGNTTFKKVSGSTIEGGQIDLEPANTGNIWSIDSFSNASSTTPAFRFLNGATVAMSIDNLNTVSVLNNIAHISQTTVTATATLTIAQLLTKNILLTTATTAVSLTLPTGTLTDAGLLYHSGSVPVGTTFEWAVMNNGTGTATITILAGTGHTIVGTATVAINTAAKFITRKVAANSYTTYRII